MRHKNQVFERYQQWQAQNAQMVVAVVVETRGSTYAKPGDFMLIRSSGEFQGLLSGGCVEGDLALRAEQVCREGGAAVVHYELGGEEDVLWGMGAGCEGSLSILLQSVDGPFAELLDEVSRRYFEGLDSHVMLGGTISKLTWALTDQSIGPASLSWNESDASLHGRWMIVTAPAVLIAGGGADVLPLLDLLASMGWTAVVAEHREHYAMALSEKPCRVVHAPAEQMGEHVDLTRFDAALIMSHHLETDVAYLSSIAKHKHWSYIGLLGPTHRRDKLVEGAQGAEALGDVLYGPVGLRLGGREPASIALSIVAHLHAVFASKGLLTGQPDHRVIPID
ncbi:MAG: XdhC family protein [Pseudomonadota bacterium]